MADAVVTLVQNRAQVVVGGGELVSLKAAQAAEPFAVRAEAALAEIQDIASDAPDSPSILNKLDKDANLSDLTDFVAARANLGVRYVGGRTFYVRPDGSDTNTGLANTAGAAFQTIQRAINAAYSIDAKGAVVQVQIADGTYAEGLNIYGRPVGAFDNGDQPLRLIGNETNPENVVINPTNKDAIRIGDKATVLLAGLSLGTTTSGTGLLVSNGAQVHHRNLRFLACATETIGAFGHCSVLAIGPTTVVGASGGFVHATNKAIVGFSGRTLTFIGSLTFTTYLWGINDASIYLDSATIVGKASGGITVHIGGILNVSSCTGVWTGGQPWFVDTGGLIIAEDKIQARTFYVRSDGQNNNSGFDNTANGAFNTIQGAVDRLNKMPYDLMSNITPPDPSYEWRIVVAAGTFTSDPVNLTDNRFSNVTIEGASSSTTMVRNYVSRANRTSWRLKGQRIGASGQAAIQVSRGAEVTIDGVDFGAGAYYGIVDSGARLVATGNFTISGSASATAFLGRYGGYIDFSNRTVTLVGTPAIGVFFNLQSTAVANVTSSTFSGAATGKRYDARSNSLIEANGASTTFLPGDVAGTTASGGQYV